MLENAGSVTAGLAELQIFLSPVSVLLCSARVQFCAMHGTAISSNDSDEQKQWIYKAVRETVRVAGVRGQG